MASVDLQQSPSTISKMPQINSGKKYIDMLISDSLSGKKSKIV